MNTDSLCGRRVLVVEDEYVIAQDMRRDLEREGAVVVGPVPSVSTALQLINAEAAIDMAILDVNLRGELSMAVAEALEARAVPFLFATGYEAADLPSRWQHVPRVEKPLRAGSAAQRLLTTTPAPSPRG